MLGELRTPGAAPLPKGLSKETLDLVARTLKASDGPLSAIEAADRAGLEPRDRAPLPRAPRPARPGGARAQVRRQRAAGAPVPLEPAR